MTVDPVSLRPSKEKNDLTDQENPKQTAGGLVGKVAGKAKEAAGSLVGNGDLAREGRLQQAQADAEASAERRDADAQQRDAEARLKADKTETEIERRRLQNEIERHLREYDRLSDDLGQRKNRGKRLASHQSHRE